MTYEKMMIKMMEVSAGNVGDIDHNMKVYTYAKTIAEAEGADPETQKLVEIEAIFHDISCNACREKYGNTGGDHQEELSEAILRKILPEYSLTKEEEDRICYVISHHHTYTGIEGLDYQILVEADFLVNYGEAFEKFGGMLGMMKEKVFKTATGKYMLNMIYGV